MLEVGNPRPVNRAPGLAAAATNTAGRSVLRIGPTGAAPVADQASGWNT